MKEHDLPDEAIEHLRTRHQSRVQILPTNLTEGLDHMRQTAKIKAELIEAEREFIYELLRDGKITDEARRRIEYELDLEEASVANRGEGRRRMDDVDVHHRPCSCGPGRPSSLFRFLKEGMERREAPGVCEAPFGRLCDRPPVAPRPFLVTRGDRFEAHAPNDVGRCASGRSMAIKLVRSLRKLDCAVCIVGAPRLAHVGRHSR